LNCIAGLAFSPDGKELAAAFCNFIHLLRFGLDNKREYKVLGKVHVWKIDGKAPQPALAAAWKEAIVTGDHSRAASSVAFSPHGSTFVTGGFDNHVAVWDAATLKLKNAFPIKVSDGNGLAVAYRPDGKLIAIATRDTSVTLYDPEKGNDTKLEGQCSWAGGATVVAFSPNGTRLAASDGKKTRVIDVTKGNSVTAWNHPPDDPRVTAPAVGVAWSPDSSRLAMLRSDKVDGKYALAVCGLWPGSETNRLATSSRPLTAVVWSPDGTRLIAGDADGRVLVWDAATFDLKSRFEHVPGQSPGRVRAFQFDKEEQVLAVVHERREVLGPDGQFGSYVRFYDLSDRGGIGRTLGPPYFRDHYVSAFALSPDGKTLVTVGVDGTSLTESKAGGTIRVWRRP
jgi:WD40 repeat protein